MSRRLAAEAIGTGLLIVAVIGSGIMAERLTDIVALQLLCNAVATGGALVALILILHLSRVLRLTQLLELSEYLLVRQP